MTHHSDDRYLVTAPTADTSYPTIATPSAPSVSAATSGGFLADATYYGRVTWITRRNLTRTSQGETAASAEFTATVSGGGGAGRIDVTIAAIPTNVIGFVVYLGTATGAANQYAVAGGSSAGTVVLKATMAQLAMESKIFNFSTSAVNVATIGTIENSNPITNGTSRSSTSGFYHGLWSPFFRDSTLYRLQPSATVNALGKEDHYSIPAGTIALNQNQSPDGGPYYQRSNTYMSAVTLPVSVPELKAFAIGNWGGTSSGVIAAASTPIIQLRSCFNNELLWSFSGENILGYSSNTSGPGSHWFDFEYYNGTTYCLIASRRHRGVIRVPVIIWEKQYGNL
jgi:hypothetical protein